MIKAPIFLMTAQEAKRLIKQLGITGVQFSALMGKSSKNYVTDFTRKGVPEHIAVILRLAAELKAKGGDTIKLIESMNQVIILDKGIKKE